MGKMQARALQGLVAGLLALVLLAPAARAGSEGAAKDQGAPVEGKRRRPKARSRKQPPLTSAQWKARHGLRLQRKWGVDIVGVRPVSSGLMLRFDYRVVDPDRAKVMTDRKAKPYLIDEKSGTALSVPAMEKIGELRQVAPLEFNRTYFIIFGNPGALVKTGNRVTLVVGNFRAEGLVVD